MSGYPRDYRRDEVDCSVCGGDGGWDHVISPHTTRWQTCQVCGGRGFVEVDMEPVTEDEIMEPRP